MLTPPRKDSRDGTEDMGSSRPSTLKLAGGPGSFLGGRGSQDPSVVGGPLGPRILETERVVRSDFWIRNGLLRPLQATHLIWSKQPDADSFGFIADRLILNN